METRDCLTIHKAVADDTRLKIIEMLSCGELSACEILESFQITQPTLSYHLKILTDCGLVKRRKDGTWIRYTNNEEMVHELTDSLVQLTNGGSACICNNRKRNNCRD